MQEFQTGAMVQLISGDMRVKIINLIDIDTLVEYTTKTETYIGVPLGKYIEGECIWDRRTAIPSLEQRHEVGHVYLFHKEVFTKNFKMLNDYDNYFDKGQTCLGCKEHYEYADPDIVGFRCWGCRNGA